MREFSSVLDQVSSSLPAFEQLTRRQKLALEAGWRWQDIGPVLDKTQEELHEVRAAISSGDRAHMVEELGDLLFMSALLCHYCSIEPDEAISAVQTKFAGRFGYVERKSLTQ